MKRLSLVLSTAVLMLGLVAVVGPAGASAQSSETSRENSSVVKWLNTHGYLPLRGPEVLAAAKARSAAAIAARDGKPVSVAPTGPAAPIIGASWNGVNDALVSPADPNGAIGPNSYIEIINRKMAIYNRLGGLITSITLQTLTGHASISDPMILWDPASQRFFYNVWDTSAQTMEWGFSKGNNPTILPSDFCNYTASFGYLTTEFPDYPKLGQTRDFLMIGVNHYPNLQTLHADRTDLLWIKKYTDPNPVATCPAQNTFTTGKFTDLRNGDNTIGFTPVPAIQTDNNPVGFVITESDIECPDICGTGMRISVHAFRPNPSNPSVPQFKTKGTDIVVGAFQPPADAPQMGTTDVLDSLDGRMTHAVSGIDPSHSNRLAVWVSHTVLGGAGSQVNWYEINPLPVNNPTLFQSGTASHATLWALNSGISNDRACDLVSCAHGDNMVLGFTTTSSTSFPASQMVSKVGAGAQSAFVVVKQSTTFDNDFTCTPVCRWGDYGGATPDPIKMGGAVGEVWLTNQWTNGTNQTWNWEATP